MGYYSQVSDQALIQDWDRENDRENLCRLKVKRKQCRLRPAAPFTQVLFICFS